MMIDAATRSSSVCMMALEKPEKRVERKESRKRIQWFSCLSSSEASQRASLGVVSC